MGQPLYCSAADAGSWGERGYGDGSTLYTWLSSITLLPWLPSFSPQAFPTTISSLSSPWSVSTVNSSPHPGIAPQSLNSSSQPLHLPGDLCPCLGCVWLHLGLILIPFRLPQISCFTLILKCFSSDWDNFSAVGIGPLLQFPHPPRAGPVLLTLRFFPLVPLSYWVSHGSIYSFPLVRYSWPLSAGVLHALLRLKVYSWCIHGERCTPLLPTSLLSCSLRQISYCLSSKGLSRVFSNTTV